MEVMRVTTSPRPVAFNKATNKIDWDLTFDPYPSWKKLEELGGDEDWRSLQDGLGRLDKWLNANGPGKDLLFLGDRVCFCDIQVASLLIWARIICGEDSEDWKRISSWHGGKWKRLVEYFDPHATVDNI